MGVIVRLEKENFQVLSMHNKVGIKLLPLFSSICATGFQAGPRGAQWLSGRVLDSRPRAAGSSLTGVTALWSLSKTHVFILAQYWFNPGRPVPL